MPGDEIAFRVALNGVEQPGVKSGNLPRLWVFFLTQALNEPAEEVGVFARGSRSHLFDDLGPNQQFDSDVLPSGDSLDQIAAPGCETIDPSFHRVFVLPNALDGKLAT